MSFSEGLPNLKNKIKNMNKIKEILINQKPHDPWRIKYVTFTSKLRIWSSLMDPILAIEFTL
jgi:hypothetical protein